MHFTCAVLEHISWKYIDDLKDECVLLELFQYLIQYFSGGWVFGVYTNVVSRESLQEQIKSSFDNANRSYRVAQHLNVIEKQGNINSLASTVRSEKVYNYNNIAFVLDNHSSYSSGIKRKLNKNESCRLQNNGEAAEKVRKMKKCSISENLSDSSNKKNNQHTKKRNSDLMKKYPGNKIRDQDAHQELNFHQVLKNKSKKNVFDELSNFHNSVRMVIMQCVTCFEAWPIKLNSSKINPEYQYTSCLKDKGSPKKFSKGNKMVPSPVSPELQGLTQCEEMLIAKAFPVIQVYIKP